jgi:hypothetical protein
MLPVDVFRRVDCQNCLLNVHARREWRHKEHTVDEWVGAEAPQVGDDVGGLGRGRLDTQAVTRELPLDLTGVGDPSIVGPTDQREQGRTAGYLHEASGALVYVEPDRFGNGSTLEKASRHRLRS